MARGFLTQRRPEAQALTKRLLVERNVLADFREPDGIRLGCSPLTTRFADVARAATAIAELRTTA